MIDFDLEAKILYGLCSSDTCLNTGITQIKPEWFSDALNRHLYKQIQTMYADGKCISLLTVYEEAKSVLSKHHTRWMLVDQAYITAGEFGYQLKKLHELFKRRQLSGLAQSIVDKINNGDDAKTILELAENSIYAIALETEVAKIITPKEHATRIIDTISNRVEIRESGKPPGIATNIWKLDRALNGGFRPEEGQLVILAAETGKGKTAFAMGLTRQIAIVQKVASLYINTEMGDGQMDCRLATIQSRGELDITHTKISMGDLSTVQLQHIVRDVDAIASSGWFSVTMPDPSINDVISTIKRFKAQRDVKIIVVDYVGRLDTFDPQLKEHQVLKAVAKRLKTVAQELKLTVIMLAQLNDELKLAGAKAMRNEADLYAYLREMTPDEITEHGGACNYFLVIDKNRDGPAGRIPLKFVGERMIFESERPGENAKIGTVSTTKRGR